MWDGVILAFSESPYCKKPSIIFLIKSIYGLEEDVGWRFPRWLFSAWPSLMSEWGDFSYFWVSILPKAFHPFLIKRIYGLEEDVCWRIPRWLFSAWPFLMCEWDDFCYFWVAIMFEAFLKFLLKRIYDLKEDVGWRIPRWLFSAWPFLMCKWGVFCFWVSILPEAFHQFSAQENIWFGRRCWLKNFKIAVSAWPSLMCDRMIYAISESPYCQKPSSSLLPKRLYGLEGDGGWRIQSWVNSAWPSLMCEWGDFCHFESPYCWNPSIKFLIKRIYGLEEDAGWRIQDGCLLQDHLWCVNGMIFAISEKPLCQ